jgi:hypothetical protein
VPTTEVAELIMKRYRISYILRDSASGKQNISGKCVSGHNAVASVINLKKLLIIAMVAREWLIMH